ncbi:hypothetical protein JHS3_21260 [Jeongeupia sp. HS-3]|uniref:hypothetical protein n=1 Tax=Jeongeupia sp. HS-3 TaxID=1009682 RepID=UPI0018A66490|nr:hypothetical protein [Jeongeupia sp. HS-3]BCL76390.1 hypothetical protein JHS3_21260 [Jeongeupia sp. HS-3]
MKWTKLLFDAKENAMSAVYMHHHHHSPLRRRVRYGLGGLVWLGALLALIF